MHKKVKRIIFNAFLVCLNGYIIISSILALYVWYKYSFIDLSSVEPKHCMPLRVDGIEDMDYINRDHTRRTYFNSFYYHISQIGSRGTFDLSRSDKDTVVLLGDSFMFGYGLNDDEVLSYFLMSIDGGRKYVNLGGEGFNLCNCVERYVKMRKHLPDHKVVILGITGNDIYDGMYISDRAIEAIDKDYKYIFFPFRNLISKNRLLLYYLELISTKTIKDITYMRYFEYLQKPIDKFKKMFIGSPTRLVIICYDNLNAFYTNRLMEYCQKNNLYLIMAEKLMDSKFYQDKLPDGHPSKIFNQELAKVLKNKFDEYGF